jgi:hypothetical protein
MFRDGSPYGVLGTVAVASWELRPIPPRAPAGLPWHETTMENSRALETDWVLIQSAGKGESEEDFLLFLSGRGASGVRARAVSGSKVLLETLRRLGPRRVILDFQVSFRHGLSLLRALKSASPEMTLLARLRSLRRICAEPLYFSVDVRTSGAVALHRVRPERVCGYADAPSRSSAGRRSSTRRNPLCALDGIEP